MTMKDRKVKTKTGLVFAAILATAGCGKGEQSAKTGTTSPAFMAEAKAVVDQALAPQKNWTGPKDGPVAQSGKTVVYVASDMKNGGILGVYRGVQEATAAIGWTLRNMDGQGTVAGRAAALNQALALKPAGIILGGFDAKEQAATIALAKERGIPIVGWHAAPKAGPVDGMFTNITTDADKVASAAAMYAVVRSGGKAGVVVFTDSAYSVAIAKSDAMANVIRRCGGCQLLSVEDTPLDQTSSRMPQLTTTLLQKHGAKWTDALAINDLYFDFMGPTLAAYQGSGGSKVAGISAGDGSISAFDRIRKNEHQAATVAEPLSLQGWQAIDELNRAIAGQQPSGFAAPVHLVVNANIGTDGGPRNVFDPENGYRNIYRTIWKGK
jgi:ribose transport system substrate-binding protein